ncbi:MAG TPA: hypothetical protein ENJ20_03360, partial [Bacteroidetes bacterium]|nr:hypothetical protein [Bacteroidota bacterium]
MNKYCLTLIVLLLPLWGISQNRPPAEIDLSYFYKNNTGHVQKKGEEFYVVDSIQCFLFVDSLQMERPTTRTYNIAFLDESGDILESIDQEYDPEQGVWNNTFHTTNHYDDEVNLIEITKQRWDPIAGAWINLSRTINVPNEFGNFTEVLNQNWYPPGQNWRNASRQTLQYNDDGLIQTLVHEVWDTVAAQWNRVFRIVYAVTPDGQIASTLFQLDINGTFQNISRETYSYDPVFTQLETERLAEIWVADSMQWQRSSRVVKEYDSNANLTTETSQLWDNANS